MKHSERVTEHKISILSRLSDAVRPRQLTDYGKDARRVYNDLMDMLHVGYPNMRGIEYRVTCQARRI